MVTLPNRISLPVLFSRDITVSETLFLKEVLYVSDFKFYLISVSAFTINSPLALLFVNDGFIIREMSRERMIS